MTFSDKLEKEKMKKNF